MATDPRRRTQPMPPPPPPPPPANDLDSMTMGLDGADDAEQNHANGEKPGEDAQGGYKLKFCTVCASNNNRSMEAHLRLSTTTSPSSGYPTISFGTGSLVRLPGPSISQPNVYSFNNTTYENMYAELLSKDARLYRANGILPMLERNKSVKWGPERWQDWRIGVPRVGKRYLGQDSVRSPEDEAPGGGGEEEEEEEVGVEYSTDKGYAGTEAGVVDVVITCEERCWDAVLDDLLSRGAPLNRPVHVVNVDIKDNHEEALIGGKAILELADELNAAAREERDVWVENSGGEGGAVNGFDTANPHARAGFDERVPEILAGWQQRWPQLPALWSLAWL